ncbi:MULTISPECIES: hypothetical protein [unclassified Streptomyces]|uniref:hypothetical protein n=1 Tax=unclassified Streptomyces TaxID=2593676 RepID=UPI0011B0C8A7|nr:MULTISPECIES: hypothetical protein [unclassified Streptomyces]
MTGTARITRTGRLPLASRLGPEQSAPPQPHSPAQNSSTHPDRTARTARPARPTALPAPSVADDSFGAAFVGRPSDFVHSHQRALMRESGVRHLISGLDELDDGLVRRIDRETATGSLWSTPLATAGQGTYA